MSDSINIKNAAKDFNSAPESAEYSKVILHIDDDNAVVSGNDTGRTLEANCPFATQEIADNLLSKLKGFRYQPYSADGALFDPATEIGDGVKISDIVGGLYSQNINFGSLFSSDIEAPQEGDIEHEYPYQPKQDREVKRQFRKVGSEIKKTNNEILLRVTGEEAQSLIDQTVDKITLSVGGEGGETVFELRKDGAVFSSETVDLKVKAVNIEGTLSADKIKGGELNLGGENNKNGKMILSDADGNSVIVGSNVGFEVKAAASDPVVYDIGTGGFKLYRDDGRFKRSAGQLVATNNPTTGRVSGILALCDVYEDGTTENMIQLGYGTIECKRLIVNGHEIT